MIKNINPTPGFVRRFRKITKNNRPLKQEIVETIKILKIDPFCYLLRSHKVNAMVGKTKWSSRVNKDIRIIWDFSENNIDIIDLLDLGPHSGSKKVYK